MALDAAARWATQVAEQQSRLGETELRRQRKLSLVVDFDQTILHSTLAAECPWAAAWLAMPVEQRPARLHYVRVEAEDFYVRIRPMAVECLEELSTIYELHASTMGTRLYAQMVISLVDPDGRLFHDRIVSRDEAKSSNAKVVRFRHLFPNGGAMALIMDDRMDVWRGAEDNMVPVNPYVYFEGASDVNSLPLDHIRAIASQNTATISDLVSASPCVRHADLTAGHLGVATDTVIGDQCVTLSSDMLEEAREVAREAPSEQRPALQHVADEIADVVVISSGSDDLAEGIMDDDILSERHHQPLSVKRRKVCRLPTDSAPQPPVTAIAATTGDPGNVQSAVAAAAVLPPQDNDKHMLATKSVLQRIHNDFYRIVDAGGPADVRPIVHHLRSAVLEGTVIILSGIVPVNLGDGPLPRPVTELYARLKLFGARLTEAVRCAPCTGRRVPLPWCLT